MMQDRRMFMKTVSLGFAGCSSATTGIFSNSRAFAAEFGAEDFVTLTRDLLTDWCDGMLKHQIDDPEDPIRHGALACPSCDFIHGRCWEALYPFLHLARATGEEKYKDGERIRAAAVYAVGGEVLKLKIKDHRVSYPIHELSEDDRRALRMAIGFIEK